MIPMHHSTNELGRALDKLDRLRGQVTDRLTAALAARTDAVLDARDANELADAVLDHGAAVATVERLLADTIATMEFVRRELLAAERRETCGTTIREVA